MKKETFFLIETKEHFRLLEIGDLLSATVMGRGRVGLWRIESNIMEIGDAFLQIGIRSMRGVKDIDNNPNTFFYVSFLNRDNPVVFPEKERFKHYSNSFFSTNRKYPDS